MSLIPSESASFPDLLGRRLGASKKSNWRVPAVPEVEAKAPPVPQPQPAAANPVVQPAPPQKRIEPQPLPKPAAALPVEAPLPPSPAKLERRVLHREPASDTPAPEPEEAAKVRMKTPAKTALPNPARPHEIAGEGARAPIPSPRMPLAKPRQRPRPVLQPRDFSPPAAPLPNEPVAPLVKSRPIMAIPLAPLRPSPVAQEIEEPVYNGDDLWDTPLPALQRRRRGKMIRFVVIELTTIGIMIFCANMALSYRSADDPMGLLAKILTIAAAVASAVIPILFYGLPDTLPRNRH